MLLGQALLRLKIGLADQNILETLNFGPMVSHLNSDKNGLGKWSLTLTLAQLVYGCHLLLLMIDGTQTVLSLTVIIDNYIHLEINLTDTYTHRYTQRRELT